MSADLHQSPPLAPPPGRPDTRPTAPAAVVGLVGSFVCWPVGLVASIVGLVQTRDGSRKGRGMAIAGVVISGVTAVVTVVVLAFGLQQFGGGQQARLTQAGQELQAARNSADSAGESAESAQPADAAVAASDPADDVALDSCEHGDAGTVTATVTVVNSADRPVSYTLVVGFDDLAGNVVTRASGHAPQVDPGASAQVDLVGVGSDLPDDLECYVDDVVRLPV